MRHLRIPNFTLFIMQFRYDREEGAKKRCLLVFRFRLDPIKFITIIALRR